MADNRRVSEELYAIAPARRRRMALVLAPLGLALLVAAVLVFTLDGAGWKIAGLLVAALAAVLLGVAWGLRRSVALSEAADAQRRSDEAVLAAAAEAGGGVCGTTGQVCGSNSGKGGCGATCLTRTAGSEAADTRAH